jgi:hypothetical protein
MSIIENRDQGVSAMRGSTGFLPAIVLGVAGAISATTPSLASLITYTEQVMATGVLDGASFGTSTSPVAVTLTMTADPTAVQTMIISPTVTHIFNIGTSLTVNVAGVGSDTFANQTQAAVNQSTSSVSSNAGFGDNGVGKGILLTQNTSFLSYDLATDIGPVFGTAVINPGQSFPTDAPMGSFILKTVSGNASFTATVSPVPVPAVPPAASLALLVVGLGALGLIEFRRKS